MSKTRVFIYGSCVSRDTFEHFDPEQFELVEYVARQSVLSAYTKPVELMAPPTMESRFQQRMITGDFSSSLRSLLSTHGSATDLVLVDLTDERLGAYLLPDGSMVTRSVELIESGAEQYLPQGSQHIAFGTQQHFEYWSTAMNYIGERFQHYMPQATVVLLDLAWAEWSESGAQTPDSFGVRATDANSIFRPYIQVAAQALGAHVVSLDPAEVMSGPHHPWGDAPFHYAEKVYLETVRRLTGTEGRVVWGPGAKASSAAASSASSPVTGPSTTLSSTHRSPDLAVTVVVPNDNDAYALGTCLESVLAQSIGVENVETVVVDNGSTDGTQQVLDQYLHRFPQGHLRIVPQERSASTSAGRNAVIGDARGRHIYFVDATDYLGPDALWALTRRAEANSSDIVLGKPVGVGRTAPGHSFRSSRDKAGLKDFRIGDALHAHTLYRTQFLRDRDIKFHLSLGTNIERHFAMSAFAWAQTISVEADTDCYFLVHHKGTPAKPSRPKAPNPGALDTISATFKAASSGKIPLERRQTLKAQYWNMLLTNELVREFSKKKGSDRSTFLAGVNRLIGSHDPEPYLARLRPDARVFLFLVRTGQPQALDAYVEMTTSKKKDTAKAPARDLVGTRS